MWVHTMKQVITTIQMKKNPHKKRLHYIRLRDSVMTKKVYQKCRGEKDDPEETLATSAYVLVKRQFKMGKPKPQ